MTKKSDFIPPSTAIEAVREKLDSFFKIVDLSDTDFLLLPKKTRDQPIADFFGIPPQHYTPRKNVAKTLLSLRWHLNHSGSIAQVRAWQEISCVEPWHACVSQVSLPMKEPGAADGDDY